MMNNSANATTMSQPAEGNAPIMNLSNKDACSSSSAMRRDSLLGMASSLLDVDLFRSMMLVPPPALAAQQRSYPAARPEDIITLTSQVLAELSDDLFSDDLFGPDALEPTPVNPNRMNVVDSFGPSSSQQQQQTPLFPSRYSFFEGTLSQLLNQSNTNNMKNDNMAVAAAPDVTVSLKRDPPAAAIFTTLPAMKKQRLAAPEEYDEDDPRRFRPYQAEQWTEKFEELIQFRQTKGHCCVPHTYQENPSLARWVKRQRYQYKLKDEGKQSTMTDERVEALEQIGFIWDSHGAAWAERLNELKDYRTETGHCNVPSNNPSNPQLATWVKCQRRQYKLFWDGKTSNMTLGRMSGLEEIGFEWELRAHHNNITKSLSAANSNEDKDETNSNNNKSSWQI